MTLSIEVEHGFGGFRLELAFAAPPGVTVLFGPSGCGKTTVLSVVAGLLRPERGRVALAGRVLLDTASGVSLAPERRRCGVVFQDARLLPHLSVATNLRYGARRAPAGSSGPGFEEVVALLGIGALLERRPRTLSGGERQRVAIGRALLSRPQLLLMDEPLASLDAPRRTEILPFLERLRDAFGLPLLYVTHALDEVDRLADTLVLMEAGRVSAAGPVADVMARTDLPLLSGRRDAGVVLGCTIAGHDPARGLTRLGFDGGELVVPLRAEAVGTGLAAGAGAGARRGGGAGPAGADEQPERFGGDGGGGGGGGAARGVRLARDRADAALRAAHAGLGGAAGPGERGRGVRGAEIGDAGAVGPGRALVGASVHGVGGLWDAGPA